MRFSDTPSGQEAAIAALFLASFTASEGPDEGRLIGDFALSMLRDTPADDLRPFLAHQGDRIVGCILFSRLRYAGDARRVFLLSPVAVAPDCQRRGIGQALIRHGLDALRAEGADVAVTYGDPAFYGRLGFAPVSTDIVAAPLPLSMPQGWIAQSLTGAPLTPLPGPCTCVPALNRADLW